MRSKIGFAILSVICLSACAQQVENRIESETKKITMENKMKIEIWSDIMCPFCYIGKRNFETALAHFANKGQVVVEWKSFQLDPSIPDVPKYQDDMYKFVADRKGLSYEQSKKMHEDLVQYAKRVGLDYKFEKALVTNSLKGHCLIQFAKTKGLGEKAEECLFNAYFAQGENLTDRSTLIALGKEIGLNEAEVNEALSNPLYMQKVESDSNEAQALGARGVPFFVINRKYAIAGAQQPNEILNAIEVAFLDWQKENPNAVQILEGPVCVPTGDCK